jgi:2-polyprenyl-3-methyl-5-hydroxy-6-metoxy-1,4-benzoquinol methylase
MLPLVRTSEEQGNMSRVEIQSRRPWQAPEERQELVDSELGQFDPENAGQVRRFIWELEASTLALSALSSALEAGILDHLAAPQALPEISQRTGVPAPLVEGLLDVLVGLRLVRRAGDEFVCEPGLASWASGRAKEFLLASLHSDRLQSSELVERSKKKVLSLDGWYSSDPEILEAQGTRSAQLVGAWVQSSFPLLDGLVERLTAPSGNFLDVGTGVGALAIEMCRQFPNLRVVGIDPFESALTLAQRKIAEARLEGRIELRAQRVEELVDDSYFDLVHIPAPFLSTEVLALGLKTVMTALRPGGWLFLQTLAVPGPELMPALFRLFCLLWGSEAVLPEQAAKMVVEAGYDNVRVLPSIPGVPVQAVAGQRPFHSSH